MAVVVRMCGWAPGDSPNAGGVPRQGGVVGKSVKLPLRALSREELLELQELAAVRPHLLKRLKEEMREDGLVYSRILSAEELRREMKTAAEGFVLPYRGGGMDQLKKGLNWRLESFSQDSYCHVVVAINSSGTGKTRGALELGTSGQVFIFYCSLASSTASTIPTRTPYLADKLATCVTTWEMGLYFVSWFEVLLLYLKKGDLGRLEEAPRKWLEKQDLTRLMCSGHLQKEVDEEWSELVTKLRSSLAGKDESQQDKEVQQMLKEVTGRVVQQMGHPHTDKLEFLFVVDEIAALLEPRGLSSYEEYPYLALRRAATRMGPSTLVLALGMMASISELAVYWNDMSKRVFLGRQKLLKPFWHLCNMDSQIHPDDTAKWRQDPKGWLVSMDRLSRCGRPLWYARYAKKQSDEDLVEFATVKLLNIDGTSAKPGPLTLEQAIALLRFTVGLDIHPRAALAREMVSGHMSTLVMLAEGGSAVWTVAASEPVLSEAASRWLRNPAVLLDALRHLKMALDLQSVDIGDRGELVSNILIMMAMWCQTGPGPAVLSLVKAMDFLRRVVGDDIDDIPYLMDGVVFFNRIVAVDHAPSQLELMEHFKRGEMLCGTLGNFNTGADKWIPIWDGKAMQPEHFSCFMASDKNKTREATAEETNGKLSAEYVGVPGIQGLGYATWLHDLRIEGPKYRKLVCNVAGVRMGFRLSGIRKSPVFETGAVDYGDVVEVLQELLELKPYAGCDEEDKTFIRQCPPWMYQEYAPLHIKESMETQERAQSTCNYCKRVFNNWIGLRNHRCKEPKG